ncbi:hypothetical protein Poli38472_000774 [Pythium oligandrum]|uniref:ATP-dependent RNA helicase n=1 Tax=Pythium oligandrum TaxID=41045 RepID=A0A8K1CEF7_PYTOL|nr:hypothetical protein Poli38472_000774 [Pythium oligandrum]|eukprot:TMW60732.1 hypothetical protein Poli38472_000774 [Pythium oligandrum]
MAGDDAKSYGNVQTQRFLDKYGVTKLAEQWHLSPQVCETLEGMKIASFFPVQAVAIPKLLDKSNDRITDICINAPTGSGKTLVYIVPIVQRLLSRVVCRVRALIVLPSRDLAIQVHQIVSHFCANTPLKCGLAIGQSNFAAEQASLVGKSGSDHIFKGTAGSLDGGQSLVDILVATPGRLVDHLEQTPGFTLQHLQFLVVDEADRLLNQSYQDWIAKIYASIFNGQEVEEKESLLASSESQQARSAMTLRRQDSINRRRIRTPLTRVLLSATLTRNPRKLASIGMSNAELTKIGRIDDPLADNAKVGDEANSDNEAEDAEEDAEHNEDDDNTETTLATSASKEKMYSTPANLEEFVIECDTGSKPLVLLEILSDYQESGLSIVFTSSVNSTHRLARLLQLYVEHPERVREYSSSLTQKQRTALVADCKQKKVDVVVCSDAMARGMDIENVANVINYDVPSYIKTYIHRVGRTARAGRHGRCVTLVKMGQMKGMLRMLKKAENNKLIPYELNQTHMKTLVPRYTNALQQLKDTLDAEKSGKLTATATLRSGTMDKIRHKTGKSAPGELDEADREQELGQSDRKRVFAMLYDQLERTIDAKQKQRRQ